MKDFHFLRKEYESMPFTRDMLDDNPLEQFILWFDEALEKKVDEANSFCLATANKQGRPSSRVLLLKEIWEEKFVFYTNYNSRKSKEMEENPYVSITFFWKELLRQVHIEGRIEKVPEALSEAYFLKRPRSAQLSAIISNQSEKIATKKELEIEYEQLNEESKSKSISCPNFWGGYGLLPTRFEFWQGGKNRLHDRFIYEKNKNSWDISRLAP